VEVHRVHKRPQLWHLLQTVPLYTDTWLARQLEMSRAWVQNWR
jgi:hypothetical protein